MSQAIAIQQRDRREDPAGLPLDESAQAIKDFCERIPSRHHLENPSLHDEDGFRACAPRSQHPFRATSRCFNLRHCTAEEPLARFPSARCAHTSPSVYRPFFSDSRHSATTLDRSSGFVAASQFQPSAYFCDKPVDPTRVDEIDGPVGQRAPCGAGSAPTTAQLFAALPETSSAPLAVGDVVHDQDCPPEPAFRCRAITRRMATYRSPWAPGRPYTRMAAQVFRGRVAISRASAICESRCRNSRGGNASLCPPGRRP